jgi:DNA-binding transcriptional LysR family regulator
MLEVLLGGEADLTVGPRPTRTDEHIEVLGSEEIVVVASPEHRFSHLDAVPLAELSAEPPRPARAPAQPTGAWAALSHLRRGRIRRP